ncbi:ABC transporter permease [Nostoc sp. FACHB-87]|uniref:ABC transporter permease n=1 Tax=Nostocales TaxID=1161 RepID=UPI00168478BB|nr:MULTISPECIES: ABC transporter permease [Nostocales]MBD2302482.1 ABC transporter permease [Nostoc sp. FACHB-190]MBD2453626.1 ABC transporter permease [Nostoc sp. FACHB-87]MBD2475420.1 ABC transporter permease [Anabaena sp. FACHB-83]MBD2489871.1 ABC transporter permease [Aulosira sp. FACHB-615]
MNISSTQKKPRVVWQAVLSVIMYIFMYLPILVLGFYSFNQSPYSATWQGFTLDWYRKLFSDDRILSALNNSLIVAFCAVGISAVLGTLMAVGLARYKFPGKSLYRGVAYLPLIIPDIAIAVATLVFLAAFAIPLSLWTIVAAHIVFCLAYIGLVVGSRLNNLDPHLEEAALDLGATPVQAFIKVLVPQLMPGIIAGCLLAFVLSLDDFLIASFTAGSGYNTLPMEIFSRIRTGVKPDINALSMLLITISAIVAFIAEFMRILGERKQ